MTSNAIVPFNPSATAALALAMKQAVIEIRTTVLTVDEDYGIVPGTNKPVLFKPGAERLCSAFKLAPEFKPLSIIEDWQTGLFVYRYECVLRHRETGEIHGTGIGSCNSKEGKYGWRWLTADKLPHYINPDECEVRGGRLFEFKFAVEKSETSGKYGKPAGYWQQFHDAIANGTAREVTRKTKNGDSQAWEIDAYEYRIPNPDIFDIVNTIDKMAQKRALVAATLIATNASAFFTQDMEDFAPTTGNGQIVEGEIVETLKDHATAKAFTNFWRAKGLDNADILAALKVTRLSDYQGTRAQADATIESYLQMPE